MSRSCARLGCRTRASATLTFDGLRRIVWIAPLAEDSAHSAGDLCRRHLERFGAPIHWEVHDLRVVPEPPIAQTLPFPEPRPEPRPEPAAAPVVITRTGVIAAHPSLPGPAVEAAITPTSPLLARAFRNAG